MNFTFEPQSIGDVVLVRRRLRRDERGAFSESYRRSAFERAGLPVDFVQDNVVSSTGGVLRGLHYQLPPAAQGKLVSVTRGTILDVALDLRHCSPSFGKWVMNELSAEGGEMLWIPEGFAHGYLVLSDSADVHYKVTAEYAPELDRGVRWDDPALAISWPTARPTLSAKDRALPLLVEAENPF